jgi:hypothetical protein
MEENNPKGIVNTHMFDVQTSEKDQCFFNIIYHFSETMKQLMQYL